MHDRILRAIRRSRCWRQRAARVKHNERHQEWSRRNRYWWHTMHPDPHKRAPVPRPGVSTGDGWWGVAMHMANPACKASPRNRNQLCQQRIWFDAPAWEWADQKVKEG